ncbi:MAG: transglutaminase domain-containing protein [Coriobacteriales bacterium]
MRTFDFSFKTELAFSTPVESHDFVLRCMPPSTPRQRVRCTLELQPDVPFDMQRDSFGNPLAVGRIAGAHSSFAYEVRGTASIDFSARKPVAAHPLFSFSSPLTAISGDMLEFLAQAASEAARQRIKRGLGAQSSPLFTCQHLMHQVHAFMEYAPGSTTVKTTAAQAFAQGRGVCQDYTHVLLALIRESGIPARYVSGLTPGEGATHAWVEAHLGGIWVGFDPTRDCMTDESYLALNTGRDWADCPIERATFQGLADQTQCAFAQMEEVEAL